MWTEGDRDPPWRIGNRGRQIEKDKMGKKKIKKPDDGYEEHHTIRFLNSGWWCSCDKRSNRADDLENHILEDGPQYWGYTLSTKSKMEL
jgi:hypothetical protein